MKSFERLLDFGGVGFEEHAPLKFAAFLFESPKKIRSPQNGKVKPLRRDGDRVLDLLHLFVGIFIRVVCRFGGFIVFVLIVFCQASIRTAQRWKDEDGACYEHRAQTFGYRYHAV